MTEKAEALGVIALAELFHDTYERLAPAYGYETRPETREFNQYSINGRLMIATVRAVKEQFAQQPSAAQSGWISVEERDRLLAELDATRAQRDEAVKALKDVRWRIADTRETLMSRKGWGDDERVYGCDEWSTPTVNLQRAVDVIDSAISREVGHG